ncbi:hypothetical protein CPB97_004694, partial [Podila verticillata]
MVMAIPKPMTPFDSEGCHKFREPCDRPDQCCPGLTCNLGRYSCEPDYKSYQAPEAMKYQMCHHDGEPCDRPDQCCSGNCRDYQCVGGYEPHQVPEAM